MLSASGNKYQSNTLQRTALLAFHLGETGGLRASYAKHLFLPEHYVLALLTEEFVKHQTTGPLVLSAGFSTSPLGSGFTTQIEATLPKEPDRMPLPRGRGWASHYLLPGFLV